jgi:hypothetical protein
MNLAPALALACAACGAPAPPELLAPAPMPPTLPPIDAAVVASADAAETPTDRFWLRGDAGCPADAKIEGSAPPNGIKVYCMMRTGNLVDGGYAQFDDAGTLREIGAYDHGKLDGVRVRYHTNGQRWTEGAYKQDVPDGTHTEWDASGHVVDSFTITTGTGTALDWFEDTGKKASATQLVGGVKDGEATEFDRAGGVHAQGIYRGGVREGVWTTMDSREVVRAEIFRAGKRVQVLDYQDGVPLGNPGALGACTTAQGARDAYRAQSKKPLSDGYSCVEYPLHFGGVTLIAKLAPDRGCEPVGVLIDCALQASRDAKTILGRAGWAKAKPHARAALAQEYAEEIELFWTTASGIESKPQVDGGVVVTATPKITLRFAASGALVRR